MCLFTMKQVSVFILLRGINSHVSIRSIKFRVIVRNIYLISCFLRSSQVSIVKIDRELCCNEFSIRSLTMVKCILCKLLSICNVNSDHCVCLHGMLLLNS